MTKDIVTVPSTSGSQWKVGEHRNKNTPNITYTFLYHFLVRPHCDQSQHKISCHKASREGLSNIINCFGMISQEYAHRKYSLQNSFLNN